MASEKYVVVDSELRDVEKHEVSRHHTVTLCVGELSSELSIMSG